jgi:tetrathionate reductase subunit B
MDTSRRGFLAAFGRVTAGAPAALMVAAGSAAAATTAPAGNSSARPHHWAMVVDVAKCIGCQACTVSCIMENRVPEDSFRTFVTTWEVAEGDHVGTAMLPRLCNHCDEPPCVPVCPVAATYKATDGQVLVDADACVGCGYCVQACPYDARFINKETRTADKCTFCAHRVEAGLLPACVETCVGGARIFGDLADPESTVSKLMKARGAEARVLKPEEKTKPNVFYLGLDARFAGRVDAVPTLWHPLADNA